MRRLNAMARERQDGWQEGSQPRMVAALTEQLAAGYDSLRAERDGEPAPGTNLEGGQFRGHTTSVAAHSLGRAQ
jgi:hypothetical protein